MQLLNRGGDIEFGFPFTLFTVSGAKGCSNNRLVFSCYDIKISNPKEVKKMHLLFFEAGAKSEVPYDQK